MRRGDAQGAFPFGLLDVANETVLVLELIMQQGRYRSPPRFDHSPDEVRSVVLYRVADRLREALQVGDPPSIADARGPGDPGVAR